MEDIQQKINELAANTAASINKVKIWIFAGIGLVLLFILWSLFSRPKLDQSDIDEKIRLRDQQIELLQKNFSRDSIQLIQLSVEGEKLKVQYRQLQNTYAANQVKHSTNKTKIDEVS